MDIQSPGDKLLNLTLQNLQKTQNEQLLQLTRLVGLTSDSISKAVIKDISNLSSTDRDQLLAQIEKTLTQLKSGPLLPAAQQQIDALEQQQKLLQSNLLKLVTLEINNKTFLVYTNQPLQKGQDISVRILPNIGLELLANPNQDNEAIKREQVITQNLRQLLPLISHLPAQKQDNFFIALAELSKILSNIPGKQLNQLVDKSLQSSLEKLNAIIPTLIQVIDSKTLKTILESSGIQFEKRLIDSLIQAQAQKTVSIAAPKITSGQVLSPQNLAPLLNVLPDAQKIINTEVNKPPQQTSTANIKLNPVNVINANNLNKLNAASNPEFQNTPKQDIKGALIDLVSKANQAMAEEVDAANIIKTASNTNLKDWVNQLIPILMGKTPQKDLSIKTLRTQLIALLQQHAYQAVAKIQIQQLQSLQPQAAQTNDNNQQNWQLEIPIRYQQDIHPMQIHIERHWVDDKEKSTDKTREKIKQWKIMLNFELPVIGHFYAQLIWLNQQLSATLWAEKADTLKLAQEKMENLRTKLQQEGIIVTQLECLPGAPNKTQNQIHYSLIDITT